MGIRRERITFVGQLMAVRWASFHIGRMDVVVTTSFSIFFIFKIFKIGK